MSPEAIEHGLECTTNGSGNAPTEGESLQTITQDRTPLTLSSIYEPDGEWTRWGTSTYGNWQTIAESRRLPNGADYIVSLPSNHKSIAIVRRREDVRQRILALIQSGVIPVDTRTQPIWE